VLLDLDPHCVNVGGNWRMQWLINNPNPFAVGVNWTLTDGQNGAAVLAPGSNNITTSELGTWTMDATWLGGGFGTLTSTITNCEGPDRGGGEIFGGPGPVIPVTGKDLLVQTMLPYGGTLLVGIALLVKGLNGKNKK